MYKTSTINHLFPRMSLIIPNLFLGDFEASQDLEAMLEHNISHIVSILARDHFLVPTNNHLLISLNDGHPFTKKQLEEGVAFIKSALGKNEGVLVHCMAGISRSSTLVSAFLMKELKYTPQQVINFIREKREIIDPAYFTFKSAVEFVYPNSKLVCSNCKKNWDYREQYEFIHFLEGEEVFNVNKKGKNECKCTNPQVIIKKKSLFR